MYSHVSIPVMGIYTSDAFASRTILRRERKREWGTGWLASPDRPGAGEDLYGEVGFAQEILYGVVAGMFGDAGPRHSDYHVGV